MNKPSVSDRHDRLSGERPAVPPEGSRPGWRDAGWLAAYSLRALWELVRARIAFGSFAAKDLPRLNRDARMDTGAVDPSPRAHIARIGYVLPRLSKRLPWRSDCLVQAMAGQRWLRASGHSSEIQIGVQNAGADEFGAHAWLLCNGSVVTGGNIAGYAKILGDELLGEAESDAR